MKMMNRVLKLMKMRTELEKNEDNTYGPDMKWNDYPGNTLYLWNGDVLYMASEDSYNISGCDESEGYKDSWVVDIYSISEQIPQGGQWMERDYISNMNYTIQGVMDRLGKCDLWVDNWKILDPEVGELLYQTFEDAMDEIKAGIA